MPLSETDNLLTHFTESVAQNQLLKLTLSNKRNSDNELKNVFVKPVMIKGGFMLSFVYRYPTRDTTKNYDVPEATVLLKHMLEKDFYKADLYTGSHGYHLTIYKGGKATLIKKANAETQIPDTQHNREKNRVINAEGSTYLRELGITTSDGKVKADKQDKYRQINKYVEIVDGIVKSAELPAGFKVADMGAGKGYLTFALYDYLVNKLKLQPEITGVELRKELVDKCNTIAADSGFSGLHFQTGSIDTSEIPAADMLIALHACDIATDQAIYRGIKAGSKVIICAPCCHKQIRQQLKPTNALKNISHYGILQERQAEILTDTIRALVLEAYGYKTKVFEFISTEHTPKNVLIVGVKTGNAEKPDEKVLQQVKDLKAEFNIGYHHLEKLLGI